MSVDFTGYFLAAAARRPPPPQSAPSPAPKKRRRAAAAPAASPAASAAPPPLPAGKKRRKPRPPAAPSAAAPPAPPPAAAPRGKRSVQQRLEAQLAGGRFRFINEWLYTRPSREAARLFAAQPELYHAYHDGFRSQSARWPVNPVDRIAGWLGTRPSAWVVGDMGCGDAQLARIVRQQVHSFDLVACDERVVACDIARVPLPSASLDAVVFSLSLMGSNYVEFLLEARRLLRPKGVLKVAEVSSRFEDIDEWIQQLDAMGFRLTERDESNSHFVLLEFVRTSSNAVLNQVVPLKPCIYKRR